MATFKKIYIEVTNRCNLNCSFCQHSDRVKAFMGAGDFENILKKIQGYTEYIYLHVLGEALLHPDLGLLLESSNRHGFKVNLSTNGTLLKSKEEIVLTAPAVRQVNISLHSQEQPDRAALAEYLDSVLSFVEAARRNEVLLNLRLWDLSGDGGEILISRDREILKRLRREFCLPESLTGDPIPGRRLTLAPGIFLSRERQFSWPHTATKQTDLRGSCRGLRDHIAILVDGTVVPCCLDAEADIVLGNIHRHSLAQILGNPRTILMRKGFVNQQLVEPLCQRCDYRRRFLSI
jgi:radical SAM protein with 4Fe4S-binding SPASM domain